MKIGLIDVDSHSGFPNLALMKLSAWHKAQGDSVEWYEPLFATDQFDRVYMSKVFTFTADYQYPINAKEILRGGGRVTNCMTVICPNRLNIRSPIIPFTRNAGTPLDS